MVMIHNPQSASTWVTSPAMSTRWAMQGGSPASGMVDEVAGKIVGLAHTRAPQG
jgi:hypothetical protein